jgi:hypothetical protein
LAEAGLSAFVADSEVWRRTETVHRQRHHPRRVVEAALARGGLAALGVFGQDVSGRIQGELVDDTHSKAVYIACAQGHA